MYDNLYTVDEHGNVRDHLGDCEIAAVDLTLAQIDHLRTLGQLELAKWVARFLEEAPESGGGYE